MPAYSDIPTPHDGGDTGPILIPVEVPHNFEQLPDGRDALVIGDWETRAGDCHRQGDNTYGAESTCGLVSCELVLKSYGLDVSEASVVAYAIEHDLCYHDGNDPAAWGGSTCDTIAEILTDHGVAAHPERGMDLESLAETIEDGRAAIIAVDAAILWQDPSYFGWGSPNHAITVTGVARDPKTNEIMGYYINDSGVPNAGKFMGKTHMQLAWSFCGGQAVVTDVPRSTLVAQ